MYVQDDGWSSEDSHMFIPALYKKDQHEAPSASASALQKVDALTAEVVESQVIPLCAKAGGDVYVQSGVGGLIECEAGLLWTAVCCAPPDEAARFSMGMVLEGESDLKVMSVEDLEKLVGIEELFPGQCGHGSQGEITLHTHGLKNIQDQSKEAESSRDTHMDTHSAERAELSGAETQDTESIIEESLTEQNSDTESSESVLLYILSSSFSLLCTPLSLVITTLTNLSSQLTYVLQEDAAVLAAVPQDSLLLVRDLVCGVASGAENVWSILYQVVENGVGSLYFCLRTLLDTLLLSCQEGVLGTGTVISDVLGLASGTLGQVLERGGSVLGSAGYSLTEYLGTMGCEMGHQVRTAGGGVGTLVWRGQRGLGHTLRGVGAVVGGVVGNAVENLQEAFGGVENVAENVQEVVGEVENTVENVVEAAAGK